MNYKKTTVSRVELSVHCEEDIYSAGGRFFSPNSNKNPVLRPISRGGGSGSYISIPLRPPLAVHTVPFEFKFNPSNANISSVELLIVDGPYTYPGGVNLLNQPHKRNGNKIKFDGLVIPSFPNMLLDKKIQFKVKLSGTINGVPAQSNPTADSPITFKKESKFVPMYLAGEQGSLGSQRYGSRDQGGDSWATARFIDWLKGTRYRFDDISGQHVVQEPGGRSLLDHNGHNNGQQVDLRYADGQGGYSERLGGMTNGTYIKKLLNDARLEVETEQREKPNLLLLQSWIRENRAIISQTLAESDTVKVHIATDFIKDALLNAKFPRPSKLLIPDVKPMEAPDGLSPQSSHLHHWHVSKNRRP